jgi:hypothetical protein
MTKEPEGGGHVDKVKIGCLSLPQQRFVPAESIAWADAQQSRISSDAVF